MSPAEIIRYRLLTYIVKELPEDFQDKYVKHELARAGALLQTGEMSWKDVYNLVLEMIQVSDCLMESIKMSFGVMFSISHSLTRVGKEIFALPVSTPLICCGDMSARSATCSCVKPIFFLAVRRR